MAAALSTLKDGLPNLLQAFDWSLKYRLTGDGASLTTLLRQCAQSSPLLILAKVDVLVAAQAGQGEGVHRGFIVGGGLLFIQDFAVSRGGIYGQSRQDETTVM